MDPTYLRTILASLDGYATKKNLVYRSFNNDPDGKEKYVDYLLSEFKFRGVYDDVPIAVEPEERSVIVDGAEMRFEIQSIPTMSFDGPTMSLIIFAKSVDDINKLLEYLEEKHNKLKTKVFSWDPYRGGYINSKYKVSPVNRNNLVGLEEFFASMKKEIQAITEKKELAMLLGASSGANYFTYGPPGTGKTSAFKALANELNIPVYTINLSTISEREFKQALSPKTDDDGICIVIIEDFDRYIFNEKKISELLNALDGVQSAYGTIRIFSANMPEMTLTDPALKSRMKRFIKFDLPTAENIFQHLMNVSSGDKENAQVLTDLVKDKRLSYRDINNYLSRFITEESLLGPAVATFESWMNEFEEIKALEQKRKEEASKKPKDAESPNGVVFEGLQPIPVGGNQFQWVDEGAHDGPDSSDDSS